MRSNKDSSLRFLGKKLLLGFLVVVKVPSFPEWMNTLRDIDFQAKNCQFSGNVDGPDTAESALALPSKKKEKGQHLGFT